MRQLYYTLLAWLGKHPLNKYENKDVRCTYPFECSMVGYCWSYANYVDNPKAFLGRAGKQKMEDICIGCELWKPGMAGIISIEKSLKKKAKEKT